MLLVVVGSSLSFASIFLRYADSFLGKPLGFNEFYPFFHWRLYGDPKGWQGAFTYRIYSKNIQEETWQRHEFEPTAGYSRYQYHVQLNVLVADLLRRSPSQTEEARKLLAFIEHVVDIQSSYFSVVKESYNPLDLLVNPANYDTTIARSTK